jgi:hypothetical protein
VPPRSPGVFSISSMPRSSARTPRSSGAVASDRCLSGATSISIAVMKAANPPTVMACGPSAWPCHSAITTTADNAMAAMSWVIGELTAPAAAVFTISRRRRPLWAPKRRDWDAAAPCSRTMRQASVFSSTTYASSSVAACHSRVSLSRRRETTRIT